MKQFWITVFGSVIGVIIGSVLTIVLGIFLIAGLIASAAQSSDPAPVIPSANVVLALDLREARNDQPSRSPFAFADPLSTVDLVRALERAEGDSRVAGVFIRANEYGLPAAQAEEIHRAIAAFRESGKFVLVHAQGFEGTSATNYFAVSGADEIWLQDTATFSASGLYGEVPFFGGALERFEGEAEFIRFEDYKNAPNSYTEDGFTPEHREATLSYFNGIYDTIIAATATDRGQTQAAMRALIEDAPYSAEEAMEAGLVDRLGHLVEARQAALDRAGARQLTDIADYAESALMHQSGPVIALIEGQGAIVTGLAPPALFGGEEMIGSDHMAESILMAARDANVRAIVLRIDSPGGSSIASDQVWDAVRRAREAGKPVIVSMGGAAASGGYYIAAPADYIVANATTLTGSIGVYGGKVNLHDTFGLIGINIEPVSVGGEFASAYSGQANWTDEQRAELESLLGDIYADFTERVAEGREIDIDRVLEIARGRVWTGAQAVELGLVDEIGGLREAIAAARALADIEAGTRINLRRFPARPSPFEAFQQMFGATAESAETLARINALMELPEVRAAIEARNAASRGNELRAAPASPQ